MRRTFLLIWIAAWLAPAALAQETLVSDSILIPPFEGQICYHLSYEGKVPPASLPYLPDSMTLTVGTDGLRMQYHGGLSDTMQSTVVWEGKGQMLWLLDAQHKTADSVSIIWRGFKPVKKPLKEAATVIAGMHCKAWSVTSPVKPGEKAIHNEKVWVNDTIYFGGKLVDSLAKSQPIFLVSGQRQIPLQTKRTSVDGVTTTATAVQVLPQTTDPSLFQLPADYKRREFDPAKPWIPMLNRPKEL